MLMRVEKAESWNFVPWVGKTDVLVGRVEIHCDL